MAIDSQGRVRKASQVYDPIGVVVTEKSGRMFVRRTSAGYILDVVAELIPPPVQMPSQSPNKAIVEAFEEFRQQEVEAQKRAIGTALNNALAGELVTMTLGGFDVPKMPPIPSIPTPRLPKPPSIPTFDFAMPDIPIPASNDMTRTIWAGLLKSDGNEVSAPDYKRIKVQLKGGVTKNRIEFPMAQSTWGTVVRVGLFANDTSRDILLEFTFGGSGSASVNIGDSVCIDNVEIECEPIPSERKPVEDLSVDETSKGPLKQRMNATRDALRKLKEGL